MNLNKLLKEAQRMQKEVLRIQEELAKKKVEVTAGGGAVKVVVSGSQEPLEVKIQPDLLSAEEVEMLEDLILAAFREALEKSKKLAEEELKKVQGGLGLPGLF
jgi:DNA-binding YbaB/EbfC family protein